MQLQKRRNYKPRWVRGAMLSSLVTISTDQLVACPKCGVPMRLSEMQTFECKACGHAVTGEEALTAYEVVFKRSLLSLTVASIAFPELTMLNRC